MIDDGPPLDGVPISVAYLTGPAGSRVGEWLADGRHLLGGLAPLVGPFPCLVTAVDGPDEQLADARTGIPDGPAAAEAVAVRLRRAGAEVRCGPGDDAVASVDELLIWSRERGRHAVAVWRADPSLLPELHIGSWFCGGWRVRLARRLALAGRAHRLRRAAHRMPLGLAADGAFWVGVREAATLAEWRRLTSSYVVLCYHRVAGLGLPGQDRWDVAPAAVRWQLRVLRLLGWRPLSPDQIRRVHRDPDYALPRRRYVVTVDDGFTDAVAAFTVHARHRPQMFAVTDAVAGRAEWFGGVETADWPALRALEAAGGILGSHARHHVRLAELGDDAIADEVAGSLAELRTHAARPAPVLAYPHGSHDLRVRDAAVRADYQLAYTTQQGRNGAGTDPWCLRRVEPKIWDSTLSFCWKVLTGESPPGPWERRLERRWRSRSGK